MQEFTQLGIAGATLLILLLVVRYFISTTDKKDEYIKTLVSNNQENVNNFRDTVNHHQTKFNASIDRLADSISAQNETFKQFLPQKRKRK